MTSSAGMKVSPAWVNSHSVRARWRPAETSWLSSIRDPLRSATVTCRPSRAVSAPRRSLVIRPPPRYAVRPDKSAHSRHRRDMGAGPKSPEASVRAHEPAPAGVSAGRVVLLQRPGQRQGELEFQRPLADRPAEELLGPLDAILDGVLMEAQAPGGPGGVSQLLEPHLERGGDSDGGVVAGGESAELLGDEPAGLREVGGRQSGQGQRAVLVDRPAPRGEL